MKVGNSRLTIDKKHRPNRTVKRNQFFLGLPIEMSRETKNTVCVPDAQMYEHAVDNNQRLR